MKTPGSKSDDEDIEVGFAAHYPKTPLVEWLGLIEFGHRDAVINLVTADGRKGRIGCVAGDIVEARCGDLAGPEAVDEMLSRPAGAFSVTFDELDRPGGVDSSRGAFLADAAPAREQERAAAHSDAPVARSLRPETPRDARTQYIAIAGSVAAMALGVWLYTLEPPSAVPAATQVEQGMSKPPAATMLVHVEVDPTDAEIWFDGKRVAIGHWHQVIAHDGRTHELRFSSPGYIPQRVFFLETAPSRHMTLERIVDSRAEQNAPVNLDEQHQLADPDATGKEPMGSVEVNRARSHVESGHTKRSPPAPPLLRRVPGDSDPPSPLTTWYDVEAQKPLIQLIDPPEPSSHHRRPVRPRP